MQKVTITKTAGQPYQHLVAAGKHQVTTDTPTALKGGDTGMTPHELFLGGLGACAAMTVEMFAERKGWALTRVVVTVVEDTVDDPDAQGSKIPRITETIELEGNLTADQVDKLKEIAAKCPVYKLFVGKKQVDKVVNHITPAPAAGANNTAAAADSDGESCGA